MKVTIFSTVILLLIQNCVTTLETQFGQNLVLYGDYNKKELVVLDLENFHENSLLKISEQDQFIFFGDSKIYGFQLQGTDAGYAEYDLFSGKESFNNFKTPNVSMAVYQTNFNDSLLIFSNLEDIFYESSYREFYDSIKLDAEYIYDIKCSNNGVLAVLYTTTDNFLTNFVNNKNLLFYDLVTHKKIVPNIYPIVICDWSTNGKYLVYYDSLYHKIDFHTLEISEFFLIEEIPHSFRFLNDSLLVYQKDITEYESQLFLYNIPHKETVRQLTNRSGRKNFFDIRLQ